MRCVIMIGVPGVGKTTVTRDMLARLGRVTSVIRHKTIYGKYYKDDRLIVLGDYDNDRVFAGTDMFSMGMQKDAQAFWSDIDQRYPDNTVIYGEGARIANSAFINVAEKYCEINIIYLFASVDTCIARRKQRGPQANSWVKGMQTKVRRLCEMYPVYARQNESPSDIEKNSAFLHTFLVRGIHEAVS